MENHVHRSARLGTQVLVKENWYKSDDFIVSRIKTGKAPGMPAFGRSFNDEQLQAIVAYIRNLRDEP